MNYRPVSLVHVSLELDGTVQQAGRLALKDRRIYFEYDGSFIKSGLELSPFKLPLKGGVSACEDMVFEGLFGLFNDSLPDGWGRLLLDRQVRRHGISPERLTPLDRLSHVGRCGMGALIFEPDVGVLNARRERLDLDYLAQETRRVLEGEAEDILPELLALSGSSAGARPKVAVGVDAGRSQIIHGSSETIEGFDHWLIKFASSGDGQDVGALEYAYSLMAKTAGVEMMTTHLFPAKKGVGYFGVKRFDRQQGMRQHVHTISGLLHADHRMPSLDYEQVMRATIALTRNVQEVEKMFRLTCFNVFAHNRDDHSKNIAFLMEPSGQWKLAPAYDLTFSSGPAGEHSTTIMGEGQKPHATHLMNLAALSGITEAAAKYMIDQVRTAIADWPHFASEAGVGKRSASDIKRVICL